MIAYITVRSLERDELKLVQRTAMLQNGDNVKADQHSICTRNFAHVIVLMFRRYQEDIALILVFPIVCVCYLNMKA